MATSDMPKVCLYRRCSRGSGRRSGSGGNAASKPTASRTAARIAVSASAPSGVERPQPWQVAQPALRSAKLVAPGAVAEVNVVDDADRLERLQVAVDRAEVVTGVGDLLGGQRALGGDERLEHHAARGRDPQAVGADGVEQGGQGRGGRSRPGGGADGHSSPLAGAAPLPHGDLLPASSAPPPHPDHTPSCGSACTVSATPTITISAADTADTEPARRPGAPEPGQRARGVHAISQAR